MTVKAVIDLPEDLYQTLSSHGFSKEVISKESKKLLALKCFSNKILSLGKSAELSGLSIWDLWSFLAEIMWLSLITARNNYIESLCAEKLRKALKRR